MTKNEGKHYPHASGLFNVDYCRIRGTMENENRKGQKPEAVNDCRKIVL